MPRAGARVTRPAARSSKQVRGKANPVEQALGWLEEKGATQVKIAGVDLDGVLRGKYVSLDKFASCAKGGLGFCDVVFGWDLADELYDNAQVTGWHTGYPDLQARIDLSTARMIPWEPATAAFLLDFVMPDGSDYGPSPRALLRRIGQRARAQGFLPKFGSEYEFFIFRETPGSLRAKGFQNLEPLDPGMFGYSWLRTSQSSDLV
ncbi:MAG TPA: glutamine synthetase, partial [Myxococcaceae bacterium]|nr:glutamine synthetase [Myxococcaceae bacterium]